MKCRKFAIYLLLAMLFSMIPIQAQTASWVDNVEPITSANAQRLSLLQTIDLGRNAYAMAWSPTENLLAVAVEYGILLFQATDLEQLPEHISVPDKNIVSLAFTPDGNLLAAGSLDGFIRIWDVATREQISFVEPKLEGVNSLAFNTDASLLASGGSEGLILWDVTDELLRLVTIGGGDWITPVRFNPTGDMVAFYDLGSLGLGDVQNVLQGRVHLLQNSIDLEVPSGWSILDMDFSPNGEIFAASSAQGIVQLWRIDDILGETEIPLGNEFQTFETGTEEHWGIPLSLAFSPDSTLLALGTDMITYQVIDLWNVSNGQKLISTQFENSQIQAIDFNHAGTLLTSVSLDGSIRFWGIQQEENPT